MKYIYHCLTSVIFLILSFLAFSCTITPEPEEILVKSVTLSQTSLELTEGEQAPLEATVLPENAADKSIVWTSSRESVATVTPDGIVDAISAGTAYIIATNKESGKSARCEVSVNAATDAVVTLAAISITCREAELVGRANLSQTEGDDLVLGVLYSTSPDVVYESSVNIEARSYDSDCYFSIHTKVLRPETTYYYRSYVSRNGEMLYGKIKSFTTLPVSSLIQTGEASDIHTKYAVLSATLDLTGCHYERIRYGFVQVIDGRPCNRQWTDNLRNGKYAMGFDKLDSGTEIRYMAYVSLDGQSYYGEERSFTTEAITVTATADVSDISYHSATIAGEVSVEPEWSEIHTGIYYSATATTADELESNHLYASGPDDVGSYSISLPDLLSGTKYYFIIRADVDDVKWQSEVKTFTTLAPQYVGNAVDLGLSVKWADCNIGAGQPHEFGEKYAWGETEPKAIYSWETYKWCERSGDTWTWTKYCCNSSGSPVDNKEILEPEDDVAHVKLGGSWRMPTHDELLELRNWNNCSWTWTEDYNETGVAGYIVKSKKSGFEDRFIFLPAAGSYQGNSSSLAGAYGQYWSSSLNKNDPAIAWYLSFSSKEVKGNYNFLRPCGCSVRPVTE